MGMCGKILMELGTWSAEILLSFCQWKQHLHPSDLRPLPEGMRWALPEERGMVSPEAVAREDDAGSPQGPPTAPLCFQAHN